MNVTQVPDTVVALIEQVAPDVDMSEVDPGADLRRAADLDSLDFQTLVEFVARDTGVEIPEADYPQVRSLRGLTEYVSAHLAM
jgi:acyl carrier protein